MCSDSEQSICFATDVRADINFMKSSAVENVGIRGNKEVCPSGLAPCATFLKMTKEDIPLLIASLH